MKKVFNTQEVAEHFHVTTRSVQNWRDKGQLAYIKIGRIDIEAL